MGGFFDQRGNWIPQGNSLDRVYQERAWRRRWERFRDPQCAPDPPDDDDDDLEMWAGEREDARGMTDAEDEALEAALDYYDRDYCDRERGT